MKATDLMEILKDKIEKYWDADVCIKDYRLDNSIEINEVLHNWEKWIFIYINK